MPPTQEDAGFFRLSLGRAFRLRIEPDEVLPSERASCEHATPPIRNPHLQAFLAWRRSVLFVIAVFLIPMVALEAYELADTDAGDDTITTLSTLKLLVDIGFTFLCWSVLRKWTQWNQQRRTLMWGWCVFFLTPFFIYLFPFRSLAPAGTPASQQLLLGMVFSISAVLTLAPKAISLMPGILRASIAAKLLFPGSSSPGWLMVLAAPIYGLLVYVILLSPYQITGDGSFVVAMIGLIGAQAWLARMGYRLARPLSKEESLALLRKARTGYWVGNIIGLVFLVVALGELVEQLDISAITAVNTVVALFVNVWLLTLIATDLVVLGLERARGFAGDTNAQHIREHYEAEIQRFVGETGPPS